jgi:phage/plasmid-associated DNA primase
VIKFNRKFREEKTGRTRDEIVREVGSQRQGLMVWALHGAVRLIRNGRYSRPKSATDAMVEWQEDADSVVAWKSENTSPCLEPSTTVELSYKNYTAWCEETGRKAVSRDTFAKRLSRSGAKSKPSGKKRDRKYAFELV